MLRAAVRCFCGLATCFGASTTTLGSEVVGVAVREIAVPLRPHRSSAIDKMETARLATKSEESLIAMSSQMGGSQSPGTQDITFRCELGHCQFQIRPLGVETGQVRRMGRAQRNPSPPQAAID